MHNANFYEELKNKMTFHDMLYNEYVDFKLGTPLDEENFNILQGNIVGYVNNKGEMSMNELVKTIPILPTNLSPIIKNLEDRGWIERFRKKDDKRFVYVRMSEEGKRKIGIHRKKVCSHPADTLNAALTDAEQQDLSDIYDRLVIYFKKMVDANKSQKL